MGGRETAIGSFEAKTRLAELLRATERGDSFLILNRGRPVARLVPVDPSPGDLELDSVLQELHRIRARAGSLLDVRSLVEEGRRL